MLNKVRDYINQYHMITQGDRIVVGVSGGADSVCLLYVLKKLCKEKDVTLVVVHINHGIRGEEANRDEQFVQDLCSDLKLEFYPYHYDIKKIADKEGLSEEEAGRNVRYKTFFEVCERQKCNKIAVAHNKNDNAETILFHLFRGTGIKGLTGIESSRVITADFGDITLIRPLLGIERSEIEIYLKSEGFSYQTDSTNLTEDYSRNKIRNKVLSYATTEINSQSIGNINETALKLREAWEYINTNVELRYQKIVRYENHAYVINTKELEAEPTIIRKGILRIVMEKLSGSLKDLESKHIDAVLNLSNKQVGRYVHLPYGMIAERGYEDIRLYLDHELNSEEQVSRSIDPVKLEIPGLVRIPQIRKIFETEIIKYEKSDEIPKSSCMKWFDYDKIENAVEIRTRKEGDYIQINSLGGRKKLKDFLIDQKVPKKLRDSQILITDGNHIMWLPGVGERMSEKYKVDDSTVNVLLMKMINLEENENDT